MLTVKTRLHTPGPTEVPEAVLAAMACQPPHPRSREFNELFVDVCAQLQAFFCTRHEVLVLTASGTAAMEAAVVNFLRHDDKVVTVAAGKFGERWAELLGAYGVQTVTLEVPWGEALEPEHLRAFLRRHVDAAAVYLTHSETSTGVAHDLPHLAGVVREESEALVVVDGISSVGVLPFRMDEWGVDVCVSGSQKGAMLPPGLAFVAVADRAWRRSERATLPRYYLDCRKARDGLGAGGTPWTPATTLVVGLQKALEILLADGLEARWAEFARQAHSLRAALPALGLSLFAKAPGDAVTAVELPAEIDARRFVRHLQDRYRVFVAGGQSQIKKRVFRVGHMGCASLPDLIGLLAVVELALEDFGWRFEPGAGVAALQAAYRNHE